jgi:hypothetical protein
MAFVHGVNYCNNMRQMAIEMSGSKDLKMSLIQYSIVIIGEDLLNGSNTMKMPSQNWLYMGKRLGMMMKSRRLALYRLRKILVWLIQFLKN